MRIRYSPNHPVDGESLAFFRVTFGCILMWFALKEVDSGQVYQNYIVPKFQFKYPGFFWLNPDKEFLRALYTVLACGGLFIALGLVYRFAALVSFAAFATIFLYDRAEYQNHYYFICVLLFVAIFIPANRVWSLDNLWLRRTASFVPRWSRDILCFLMGCVYFFGGVAKLNADWLQGFPMAIWADRLQNHAWLGSFLSLPYSSLVLSYAGLFFDLTIVGFLLWRRTRLVAFLAVVLFHILNSQMFSIGLFPWLSLVLTAMFFSPSWPRRMLRLQAKPIPVEPTARPVLWVMATLVCLQVVLPLRYHFLADDPSWTRFGHLFSWRMKLNSQSGYVVFDVVDKQGNRERVMPKEGLTKRQVRKMSVRPELIRQYAHYLRDKKNTDDVKVYAQAFMSLNGRAYQRFVDPQIDLSKEKLSLVGYSWVLPNKVAKPQRTLHPHFHQSIDVKTLSSRYSEPSSSF